MSRTVFGNKSLNSQRQRPNVDRFVSSREEVLDRVRKQPLLNTTKQSGDIWYAKHQRQRKYTNYLNEEYGLEPLKYGHPADQNYLQPWPCVQRKKKYMSSADSVLDLPSYSMAIFSEVLDWSNDNILVAALDRKYYKWSWRSQSLVSEGTTQHRIQCCKFDPRGDTLILGTDTRVVEIHSNADSKWLNSNVCNCAPEAGCSITAIDWSPTGNSFITGCSLGYLVSFHREGFRLSCRRYRPDSVLAVRVSPDARYVAAVGYLHSDVLLLLWPSLEIYSNLNADWTVNSIAWHPWRSALLGVGATLSNKRTRLALWDTPPSKVRDTSLGEGRFLLDAMLFSHRTGELVVSLWNPEIATSYVKNNTQLMVLSDPWTVVDQWGEGRTGLDRIRTMVFSPDGTKLATATMDEDLIIWNFLPEDKDKNKKKTSRKFSALPTYLDEISLGYSFR